MYAPAGAGYKVDSWYNTDAARMDYSVFRCLEDFISVMEETVYKNDETRREAATWLTRFKRNYQQRYGVEPDIPRWYEIKDSYDIKRVRKLEKATEHLDKSVEMYNKQLVRKTKAQEKYDSAVTGGNDAQRLRAEEALNKANESQIGS